jgi:UDP-N-acetyl-D-glucosamine dehydrogenase
MRSIKWNQDITAFDIAVISTAHDEVNHQELADWVPLIIDTRNAMYGVKTKLGQLWKA